MLLSHIRSDVQDARSVRGSSVIPLTKYLMTTTFFHRQIDDGADRWLCAFGIRPECSSYQGTLQRFRSLIIEELTVTHHGQEEQEDLDLHTALNHVTLTVLSRWFSALFPERDSEEDLKSGFSTIRLAFLGASLNTHWQEFFLEDEVPDTLPCQIRRHLIMPHPPLVCVSVKRQEI